MLATGFIAPTGCTHAPPRWPRSRRARVAVVLAFPVAMALATGVEAPLTAIAQLGQLDDRDRRRFGRGTLALTILIVGALTLALAGARRPPRRRHPGAGDTRRSRTSPGPRRATARVYAAFQPTSAVLLLSAASSSFAAGPGFEGARRGRRATAHGILPGMLGRTNRHHTPYWAVVVFLCRSAASSSRPAGASRSSSCSTRSRCSSRS